MAFFEVVNNEFNRANYPDIINCYYNDPPAYAVVRKIDPYRLHSCWQCRKDWMAPVVLSNNHQNVSGEQSVYCPDCHTKSSCATAWKDKDGNDWVFPEVWFNTPTKGMTMNPTVEFDKAKLKRLKQAYQKAINNDQEIFLFDNNELLVGYSKYLIEYLESQLK